MPAIMKVSRSTPSLLRFCQSVLSVKPTWNSFWSLAAAAEIRLEAIGMPPQYSGKTDGTSGDSKKAKARGRATLLRSPLTSLCAALLIVMSYAVAGAQTATTTTLSVTPTSAANESVFAMTATVKAGTTALSGGTVTFRDTYNSITQVLGAVQVQSAHGTAGKAVLHMELGGIGTHSIVATFNGFKTPTTYLTSVSAPQSVTLTGLYPTVASLVQTGGTTGNYSLTTTIVGVGSLSLLPTGNVSILDTNNSNLLLGVAGLGGGTFGQQTVTAGGSPINVGSNPLGVVAGDFNNNGKIDIVVLNSGDNTTSILNGNGAGGFTASGTTRTTGNGPVAIVAGDFDGDGNLDFAVANSTDKTIWVRLGNGDGTFSNHATYSVSLLTITSIAVGDFNGDGIPDIAVAGTTLLGGAVDILQGDGTGAFTNVTSLGIAVGNGPSSIVTGDFNGDGNLDFAVANLTDNTVSVMKGNGTGTTFTAAAGSPFSTGTGTSPAAIAAGDFNGDGQLDLAVAESTKNRVDIFKGNGDGTFSLLAGATATGNKPVSIVAGDFNADGKLDFAVTNQSDNTTTIMLGTGTGTVFMPATASPFSTGTGTTSPVAIAAADFNGDGTADLAVANSNKNNVGILLNQLTDTSSVLITGISVPGSGGNHTVEASYVGDSNFAASSETLTLQSTKVTTSTLLSASTTTPSSGQQVVLTATLQPSLVGALTPTGIVVFKDGTATIGTATVSGGVATLNITSLATGSRSITAFYPGDNNFVASTSPVLGISVGKAVPVITWANPSPITYWTLLSSTQLNATANVPGTFAYSQPIYTLLPAGTNTLSVTFTPTDSTDYTIATASVTLVVNPATPQISWATPAPISFGTPLSGIQLNATAAVYNMVPLSSYYNVNGIYTDGFAFGVPPGGTGGFDGTGAAYSSNLLGTSVTWNNITYPLGPTNAPDAVANTTITLPAGHYASLNMLGALVNGNVSTSSTFVVTYTDNTTTTVTQSLSDWVFPLNYPGESVLTCVPYRDTSSGGRDAHLTCVFGYQIPLDSTKIVQSIQLPATRNNVFLAMALVSPPVPGTMAYTPPSGTVLPTGANTLSATFTPTDQIDYTGATGSVQELVNPANAPTLLWPTPAPITYGTALSATQLNAQAQTTPGTTSVSLSSYYRVNAFQSDGSLFSTGGFDNSGNAFSSNQVGSSIVWNGQTYSLGPANLPNAVTSTTVALPQGTFTSMTLIGAATTPGQTNQTFTLNFTDGTSGSGQLNMSSWTAPAGYSDETIVSTTPYRNTGGGGRTTGNTYLYGYTFPTDGSKVVKSLTLPNNRNIVIVAISLTTSPNPIPIPGTFTYTPPAGTVPDAGTIPLSVLFTPTNSSYGTATATVNLVVNKANLVVTGNSQTVNYGTTLTPYSYNITGFVNGDTQATDTTGAPKLSTTPATPVNVGSYTLNTAIGTLASSNYSFTSVSGLITINPVTLTVNANSASRVYKTANPTLTGTITGAVNGDTFTESFSTTATLTSAVGTYPITPVAAGTHLSNYTVVVNPGTLTVTQETPVITWVPASPITYGTALSGAQLNATATVAGVTIPGTMAYTPALGAVLPAGSQTLSVTFTPTDTTDYKPVTQTVPLTVNKAILTLTASNASRPYNTANPTFTGTITGAVNGDTFTESFSTTATIASPAGGYPITPSATGANLGNYTVGATNGTLTVTQVTPVINWTPASPISYGTPLGAAQLNATVAGSLPGTLVYTPASGAVLPQGTQTLSVTFTPTDTTNYKPVTQTAAILVNKANLTVTANSQTVTYGTALAPYSYTITGFVNSDTQATATAAHPR
jgi:hypothetical protein